MQHIRDVICFKHYSYRTEQHRAELLPLGESLYSLSSPPSPCWDGIRRSHTISYLVSNEPLCIGQYAKSGFFCDTVSLSGRVKKTTGKYWCQTSKAFTKSAGHVQPLRSPRSDEPPGSPFLLMVQLLYGSGMRLMEVLRLRIKDIDFHHASVIIRDGKGRKDRITVYRKH